MDIKSYLSIFNSKPINYRLDKLRKTILIQVLDRYETRYSTSKSVTQKQLFQKEDGSLIRFSKSTRSTTKIKSEVNILRNDGLIEELSEREKRQSLSGWSLYNINLHHSKPYRITDYGLFCILLDGVELPSGMLTKYWKSVVIQNLLAPYMTRATVERASPSLHFAIAQFLAESCELTRDWLSPINKDQESQEDIPDFGHVLERHAQLFAVDCLLPWTKKKEYAPPSDQRMMNRPILLHELMQDMKFKKFTASTISGLSKTFSQFATESSSVSMA
jgi:hypothetical protein